MCSLYLPMKRHPVCITSTTTAYATIDTTIIHHVYKPDFFSLRSYFLDRKLEPVCHQIGGHVRSSFLLGQWWKPSHCAGFLMSRRQRQFSCRAVIVTKCSVHTKLKRSRTRNAFKRLDRTQV